MRLIEDQSDFLEEDINPIILKYVQNVKCSRKTELPIIGRIDPETKRTLLPKEELDDWEY